MEKKILATVGQKEITNLDIDSALNSMQPHQAMHFQSEEGKKHLLNDLINQELFYIEANEQELHNNEEFKTQMAQVKETLLKQYAINKVIESVTLTDEEKKAFYEANKAKFAKPETATAKHILVDTEEQANDVLNKINANEISFEEAAGQFSSCPSKEAGGNLGEFSRGQMVPEFEEAVFNMKKDEISSPVKTQFGYHLIKLEGLNEGGEAEYEEVQNEIENTLMYQKQNLAYTQKVDSLHAKYTDLVKLND